MTEELWHSSDDPLDLLRYLDRPQGDRKLRLFGTACCRVHWNLLTEPASRNAVEWAELYADGGVVQDDAYLMLEWQSEGAAFKKEREYQSDRTEEHVDNLEDAYFHHVRRPGQAIFPMDGRSGRHVTVAFLANHLMCDNHSPYDSSFEAYVAVLEPSVVRDVFGNPFRPVAFDPAWQTGTAVALAQTMYDARDFAAMPILADALEDAGCGVPDVLNHCRDPQGVHVRGCWVVDLVLGKE